MEKTPMFYAMHKLRDNRTVEREKRRYFGVSTKADKELLRLLKEIKQAKYNFLLEQSRWNGTIPKRSSEARVLNDLYATWSTAVQYGVSFLNHLISEGNRFPNQTVSEDLVNELKEELDDLKSYKRYPATSSIPNELDKWLDENEKKVPIDKLSTVQNFIVFVDKAWRGQLQLVDDFYANEIPYNSNGERVNPNPPPRNEKEDAEFTKKYTKDFVQMFQSLISAMRYFDTITSSIVINKNIDLLESLNMDDIEDLKIMVENIEYLKTYLDEKNLQILNESFPQLSKRFFENYEKITRMMKEHNFADDSVDTK